VRSHIVLIGLPGAGKTTVGRLVAERLGAVFVDSDLMIQRRMNMPVTRIFAEYGEARFRQMETEVMSQALEGPAAIIAPGGGWAAQPGALEQAKACALIVYLKTLALTAAKRTEGGGARPLLVGEDPVEKMRELLKEREPFYLQADAEVKADARQPAAIADEVVDLARERAGW
jgi:shikimate kinase